MRAEDTEAFNLTRMLQRWKWPRVAKPACEDREYTNLLRYALQIAAEREIAELSELLEQNAPEWYADEQHERVESALELLQRL
jgi:hypothetical protein